MAKKKQKVEIKHSKYQEAIFDFIQHGVGNLVVEASAGSGKSYTLLKCLELVDKEQRILLSAFNRDIVTELKKKSKNLENVHVMTLHGLGLSMLQRNYPNAELELDEFKYRSYVWTNIKNLSKIDLGELSKRDYARYVDNVCQYVSYGRCYLCQTVKDLELIEERYGIDTYADEKEVALDVIEWGKNNLSIIDFTDMIYLPNALMCKPLGLQFDWIAVDEAQDLSTAQREIVLKCRKLNTRMLFFGDSNQCVYMFNSSDPESFNALKDLPNTTSLPLSISYRCAKRIVDFAKEIVPSIEENGDGREGEIKYDVQLEEVQDGDMIICRNNAPLMQIYTDFLKLGKKCAIRGKDIGSNLAHMVTKTKCDTLQRNFVHEGVFPKLYDSLLKSIYELMGRYNITFEDAVSSSSISIRYDMVMALEILSEGLKTSEELIAKIGEVFSDRKKVGISLSTIHKAKGLEANNVYVACRSLMPSSSAKKDWEVLQEHNLMYVAYTRAKDKLGFLDESSFEKYSKPSERVSRLHAIEGMLESIYGKSSKSVDASNPYVAKDIIRHATRIEKPKSVDKVMSLTGAMARPKDDGIGLLGSIMKRKVEKKKKIR